jgi:NTE family protein
MATVATGGIGLVLGAGGVAGHAWHAGVLAALHEGLGWDGRDADVVVGTSAGSAVAAILRAGMAPADVFARATGAPLSTEATQLVTAAGIGAPYTAPRPTPPATARGYAPASPATLLRALRPWDPRLGLLAAGGLPRGATDTAPLADGIGRLHGPHWPERALWLCAVRLRDGKLVVFGRDPDVAVTVGEAVAASCAIPGYFAPVSIGGEDHVDGGAHSPSNADLLAEVEPRLVIISSPMTLDRAAARRPRAERMLRLAHRTRLAQEVATLRRRGAEVVSFQPGEADLAVIGPPTAAMDPRRRAPVAHQARETTLRRLERPEVRAVLDRALG